MQRGTKYGDAASSNGEPALEWRTTRSSSRAATMQSWIEAVPAQLFGAARAFVLESG